MSIPFVMEHVYNATIQRVWEALTETEQMKQWYFPQLVSFEPFIGCKFKFGHDGSPYQKEWTVTEVIKSRKLAHTWVYKGYPGLSEVSFELFPEGDKTRLRLTHTGLESFPDDPHFARSRFEGGWATIIGNNLNKFLENTN
jgi:uncharacterized protein YndB with AHSA1/START domain